MLNSKNEQRLITVGITFSFVLTLGLISVDMKKHFTDHVRLSHTGTT